MTRLALCALVAFACSEKTTFSNPCDPKILDPAACRALMGADLGLDQGADAARDAAPRDATAPDAARDAARDARPPPRDMTVDATRDAAPDMAPRPDLGAPPTPDLICRVGEQANSADCVDPDCNAAGCPEGTLCDSESGRCGPPGPGDCALQGCLNDAYCGPNGQCFERCYTAGCPAGRRCNLETYRCTPDVDACAPGRPRSACLDTVNIDQGECEKLGGRWGVWVDRGDSECNCPTDDGGCPCERIDDCNGHDCIRRGIADQVCEAGPAFCPSTDFPELFNGCFCGGNDGAYQCN